ncbi:MAG: hypothetical protein K2J51_02360 [Alistipes sp.]|nr:hypothetical protein [Alistipes sp.]MDE6778306.1 hypothetical protein [Alistipes sp.]
MELDELKTGLQALDRRIDSAETRISEMAAGISRGKFLNVQQRIRRTLRVQIVLLLFLPCMTLNITRFGTSHYTTAMILMSALFVVAMLIRQTILLDSLARIDIERQSIAAAAAAVVRFRRRLIAGSAAGAVCAVPFITAIGLHIASLGDRYMLYGFIFGIAVGIPIGLNLFLRKLRETDYLAKALADE